MAEPLKTILGFEASGAIATLNNLAMSLEKYTAAMNSAASATSKYNSIASGVDSKLKSLNAAAANYNTTQRKTAQDSKQKQAIIQKEKDLLQSVRHVTEETANTTKKASAQMILSWQSVIRIFTIQVIHQAISKIVSSLHESVSSALELEIQFAEIQTISKELSKDFEGVSSSVRELSDNFGIASSIVAEGTYQTLSNQVAKGAEAFEFMAAAADFSIAAVTDLDSSVDLLSSVINSFGYNASQADVIAGKLFKTIELGKVRGEELSDSYGRVLRLAGDLGVAFDEVNASMATLTISGLKYNEAYTLINNVMLKLIRPTEALKSEMKALGIVSAEAGIQAYGFQGFLELLRSQAGGTATELGKLFGRVRAIRGALGLTGAAAETYAKNLKAIEEAGSSTILEAKELVFKTNAKQVQVEVQRLKNAVTFDFGRNAVATINTVIMAFGGLVNMAKLATSALTVLGIAAAGLGLKFLWVHPFALGVAAATVAVVGLTMAYQKLTETGIEGIEKRRQAQKDAIAKMNLAEAELAEVSVREMRKQFSEYQKILIDRIAAAESMKKTAIAAEEYISSHLNRQLDARKSAFSSFVKAIESSIAKAADNIKRSQDDIFSLQIDLANKLFERKQAGRTETEKGYADIKRGSKLLSDASKEFRSGQHEKAAALISESNQLYAQAQQIGEATNNLALQQQARNKAISSIKTQIDLQKEFAAQEASRSKSLGEQLPDEKARETRIASIIDQLKQWKQITGKGLLTFATPEDALKDVQPYLDALQNEMDAAGLKFDIFKSLDQAGATSLQDALAEVLKPLEDVFTGKEVSLDFAYKQRINEVFTDIQNIALDFPIEFRTKMEELGFDVGTLKGIEDAATGLVTVQQQLEKAIRATSTLRGEQLAHNNAVEKNVELVDKLISKYKDQKISMGFAGGFGSLEFGEQKFDTHKEALAAQKQAAALMDQVKSAADRANESVSGVFDAEKYQTAITSLRGVQSAFQNIGEKVRATEIGQLIAGLEDAAKASQNIALNEATLQGIEEWKQGLASINPEMALNQEQAALTAQSVSGIGGAASSMAATANAAFSSTITGLKQVEAQARATAAALAEASGGGAKKKSLGGMIYRQYGGFLPRGTDTIPAMLSPGEFVVNAKSARRFYTQLVAMNAGTQPVYRHAGGPVTNIGDISIKVEGAPTPTQTARETMGAFRREMRRRGTVLN